ncbi:E3 ubiquitin-protein ligase CHFR isoform X1 [Hydra vulgaris]|uniref:E3 ubiquitin-protein ligase CHFR isoform X1 n=1 Tax=Hydra vulgaris TaxID=6087 RepID=UPI001F5E73A6|nr:E3 ubiquitin-protein ligase CHFR [Hydra vulgaris]XP_047142432.1 E3 ubiquitin-protein ligase CHFR [Hydra vulgaris]XP_047142433.1 E3 ubiquitin-protein ligase CHFR [Hydra vulgaris]
MDTPGPSSKRSASPSLETPCKKSLLSTIPEAPSSCSSKYIDFEENLICVICQEIFHDCYSCQPCMHSFCAGCYSVWKLESSQCPTCRKEVESVYKNHTLNNLSLAYLNLNPNKCRSKEDLLMLDKRNTLSSPKTEMIKCEVVDSDSNDEEDNRNQTINDFPRPFHLRSSFKCRECVGYSSSDSTDSDNLYQRSNTGNICQEGDTHLICSCCFRLISAVPPLSDRRCVCCGRFFCHLYWKCSKPGCCGCLSKFKDMDLDEKHLSELISKNPFESEILKNYLVSKNMKIKDLLTHCLQKLDLKQFTTTKAANINSEDILCYCCVLTLLKELAYQYRVNIPSSELPVDVVNRPNCYWGNNCRTQTHSPNHARKFNHICTQTRFS